MHMYHMSSHHREELLHQLANQTYDVVVIGGGATGSGIALDAASRGLKTALVEKQDFASGTSSRSTKLIHGGLRYLKQFEISLVKETGRERAIVHKLAPHLVVSEKMLLPLIKGGTYGKLLTSVGLMVYDVLAGVESADQRIMLNKEETMKREPLLREDIVEGSGYYAEYRTDDARLTIELVKTAARYGAHSVNYTQVEEFLYAEEEGKKRVVGVRCRDNITGTTLDIAARKVINAAGPWVDELREKDKSAEGKHLHLTKGVHIVVPFEKFPVKQSIYFDVPDGRMIFAIPRGRITYVGTTDTNYDGIKENPRTNVEDVEYLVNGVNNIFPEVGLTVQDVISSWAGLRPLIHEEGKSASEISRKDEIFVSGTGLISIAGGKLTGYRKMAERTVDLAVKHLGMPFQKCKTSKIVLTGGEFHGGEGVEAYTQWVASQLDQYDLDALEAHYLVSNYGKQVDWILNAIPEWQKKGHSAAEAMILAELDFCLQHEMIQNAQDFFIRRTGRLYFNISSIETYLDLVLDEMAEKLSKDDGWKAEEKQKVETYAREASNFPSVSVSENLA